MAQPINIPILYTGLNAAVPDWKTMGANIRESFRNIKNDVIANDRYQDALKAREREQFLKELDIDRVTFANEQLQEVELKNYQNFEQFTSELVQNKLKGKGSLDTEDYMLVRSATNKYANEMQSWKNSEERRQRDIKVIEQDIDKFDKEKAKDILYWDYAKNGRYTGEELKNALRDIPEEERIQNDQKNLGNADRIATYVAPDGFNNRKEVKDKYIDHFYNVSVGKDGMPKYDLKAENAVDYMYQEYSLPSRSQELNSLLKDFDSLPDNEEKVMIDIWGREKAPVAWYTIKNKDRLFPITRQTAIKPVTTSGTGEDKRNDIDVTSGYGDMRGASIGVTGRVSGAMTLDGEPMDIVGGKNDSMLTNIRYMNNPKTGKKEWMVEGIYKAKKGDAYYNPMTGTYGKQVVNEPFLVPYDEVKEPIEDKYRVKGMESLKAEESDNTVRYTVKGKVYDIPASEEKAFLESFPKAKKQ